MSYLLNTPFYASGKAPLTVPAGGSLNTVTVNVAGISKAGDIVLVTLDLNGQVSLNVNELPYVFAITDGASFTVAVNLDNANPGEDQTALLNYVVIR